ncbi:MULTISPECIES: DUF502 domain-containing protein [unclassified Carboxylicivirga]|uniref:DUF502 domain-containing protein n=1 Tax=Carboxylicivirga TaxID=1628153 RepID=UPI003D3435CB
MKKLAKYFFQGLLYVVPLAVTLYVIVFAFLWLDGLLRDLSIFQRAPFVDFNFPGLGLLAILIIITFIGFIGQKLITSPIENRFERGLKKAPLIKVIYSAVKDLLSAFVGKERKFEKPVLVTLDEAGVMQRFGFITATELKSLGIHDKIAVYLPSSYGILGELYVVPAKHVQLIDAHPADVMKFIVSGGVAKIK